MKSKLILIVLVSLLLVSYNKKHEYYVSVTQIGYSEKDKSVQIISQIFIDDLEELLRKRYDETITLDPDSDSMMVDDYLQRYLSDKLNISINDKIERFNFLGKEYKEDIAYCYLEISNVPNVESIKLTNKILFDVFNQQQNIVRIKMKNKNKSFLLIMGNEECMLNFN
ncbi:DUF6702 family protein [Winogradskyella sp.]|uniref:DUF6702 family protein n=1 Tax=Winogradskyella sp. TaxID=1883156 RepID=UPI002603E0B1|nr:DUF6702 family protein [Winogradskyella sp.]